MIRIVHTFGARAGAVDQMQKSVIRFGRAPDNDIVFDPNHDRDAGSYHAEVRSEGGQWFAVDLQSQNGLFLRGRRISKEPLQQGDELVFGANGPRVRIEMMAQSVPPSPPQAVPHQAVPHQAVPHQAVPLRFRPLRFRPRSRVQRQRLPHPAVPPLGPPPLVESG